MGTHKIHANLDVDGEVQGTSLDINGNADVSGHITASSLRCTNIVTNKVVKFNGTQLDDANITDTGSLITLGSNTVVSGELEATSLDINGNADISGNLTGVDAFTASGKIQGAELEGTSLDINGNGDVSGTLTANVVNMSGGDVNGNLYADRYFQAAHGYPTNNLGAPTVTEMALFENQFKPQTTLANSYNNLADLTFFTRASGSGESDFAEVTSYSDDQKRKFLRTNNSTVVIPNGHNAFRIEFNGHNYTFANAMVAYWSSQSHSASVHVWKRRCDNNTWYQHTSSTTAVGSWPGHLYLPFGTIAWHETNTTSSGHYNKIRIEFTNITWSTGTYSDRVIALYGMQIWGGYPSGRRTVHSYDQNGKLNLFGDIGVPGNIDVTGTIYNASWDGDVIPSAKLDTDTAHLSTTQTFSGSKTFSALASFTMDGNTITGVDDSGEFTNDDAHIMTSAAIEDKILSYGYGSGSGSGDVTLAGAQTFTGAKTFTDTLALTGTGRITGIDTVSASTDAASKAYVDGAVIANTDTQDLSISGQTLSLTNGGSVTLPDTNTQLSTEAVQDIVGAMVQSNSEDGISVAYQDGDGTLDFTVGTLNQNTTGSSASCTGNAATATKISSITNSNIVQLTASQTLTNKTIAASQITEISNITASEGAQLENIGSTTISATQWGYLGAATGAITNTDTNTQLSTEQVQDIVGGMLVGTETRIGVSYDDTNGRINFVVDDMTANDNTQLSNAQVRAAVAAATDSQVFTDADHTKLNGIATNATADQTNVSGSSGSCTGNAATATALTSGNKSITGTFTVSGNINANGNIVGDDGTSITNITDIECDTIGSDADNTTVIQLGATSMNFLVADNDMMGLTETSAVMYGIVDITGTTDATNATGDTGILRCEGGASIAKKLYVGSTITGSADVIAFSDRKLKENIETLDGKKVLDMRGVSFTRKDTGAESSGVIAQEIQKVAPELVHDTEGTLGVAYGNLVGYLIEAVKDQQKQIDELKALVNGSSK